jgi:hypothetical protein
VDVSGGHLDVATSGEEGGPAPTTRGQRPAGSGPAATGAGG